MDSGDTAWMLMSTALVMIMLPGLALFYGGLVHRKNVLSTVMHSFFGLALVTVVWVIVGFTLAFGPDVPLPIIGSGFIGGLDFAMFNNVGLVPSTVYAVTIPFVLFASFQLMFAAITPALITGAFAERKRFGSFVLFTILWSIFIYSPLAHWVWSVDGWLYKLGALDFAGGTVVHISSGVSALVVALLIGRRHLNGSGTEPHDVPMVVLGAGLLWFGWFGFNAGSALTAGGLAASAFTVTNVAAAAATITWVLASYAHSRKVSVVGAACGAVAGLVAITPASGFVTVGGALIIGLVAGGLCFSATLLRARTKVDDALDVFAVHGVGGAFGAIATGHLRLVGDPERLLRPARGQPAAARQPAHRGRRHHRLRGRRHVRDHQARRCPARDPRQQGGRGDGPRPVSPRRGRLSGVTPGASRPTSALPKPAAVVPIDGGRFPTLSGVESVNKRPSDRKIAPLYEERFEHDACGVGFVADAGGRSHERVLPLALAGLAALSHRGAFGADGVSSDGAGVALPLSRSLLALIAGDDAAGGVEARPGVVSLFLPRSRGAQKRARALVETTFLESGLTIAAWRSVPFDVAALGATAADSRPAFAHAIVERPSRGADDPRPLSDDAFERRLVVARRRLETAARAAGGVLAEIAVPSASARTIVYKGLVTGGRLPDLYPDLRAPLSLGYTVFHQRYATNTHPVWRLAQPFRSIAHNGEINTVRGNREQVRGRSGDAATSEIARALLAAGPLLSADGSDSLALDEALELLTSTGWALTPALLTAIPEALGLRRAPHPHVATLRRRTAGFLAPWDGPAAIVFADGQRVGALVDRNGLRPAAFAVTT